MERDMEPEVAVPPADGTAPGGCPYVDGVAFDPQQPDQVLNPHPWMDIARRESPIFYVPEYDEWCVTRYDDVLAVLRDTQTYSSVRVVEPRQLPGLAEALPDGHPMDRGLINTDPPSHTHLRKMAQKAFTPKMVATYEPAARATAHRLIDGFLDRGGIDLHQDFSRQFTSETIARVVGAPAEMADQFQTWSDNNLMGLMDAPPMSPERERLTADGVIAFDQWLRGLIEERRKEPLEDFTSMLVTARSDDGSPSLTTFEIVRILTNTIMAGLDTSASMIGLMIYQLCTNRSRWERLLADRSLVEAAVEETLRFDGPVHGIRRDVLADTVIAGVPIPAGSKLYLSYASAMRDETTFLNAAEFDLDRPDVAKHFAFGKWTHFCLGAPLARMEGKVALEALLQRIPSLRVAPGAHPEVMASKLGAFLTGLRVEWDS
jgi:cytochrome P450